MSATNKTPNMELPIYVAEDKPTYLGDWNSTMSKIDTTVTATRNVADSAMETASNANNGVATNTESIGALQTDVQLVKSNQTAINDHLTDIDNSITVLNTKATKTTSQLNSGDIAFQFGVDSDGNYGYIKAGADTVTPFKSAEEKSYTLALGQNKTGPSLSLALYAKLNKGDTVVLNINLGSEISSDKLDGVTVDGTMIASSRWTNGASINTTNGVFVVSTASFNSSTNSLTATGTLTIEQDAPTLTEYRANVASNKTVRINTFTMNVN